MIFCIDRESWWEEPVRAENPKSRGGLWQRRSSKVERGGCWEVERRSSCVVVVDCCDNRELFVLSCRGNLFFQDEFSDGRLFK